MSILKPFPMPSKGAVMPLKKGSTNAAVSNNIKTLVHEWEKSGSIGQSHPASKKKAVRQAVAIALTTAGKSSSHRASKK
jgi:hypothetical protein